MFGTQRRLQIANRLFDVTASRGLPPELPGFAYQQQRLSNIGTVSAWPCNGSRNAQCVHRVGLCSPGVSLSQRESGERWQQDLEQRDIALLGIFDLRQ